MEGQISFPICFCVKSFTLTAVILALILFFVAFMGLEISSILATFTLVILSSIVFTSMKKQETVESPQESQSLTQDVPLQPQHEPEIVFEKKVAQDEEKETSERKKENQVWENHVRDFSFRSSDYFSESDGTGKTSTSEDFELEWSSFGGTEPNSLDFSRSSISDDDNSFIEITLPSGQWQSVGHHKEDNKFNQQHKCLDMFPGVSTLKQQFSLMDLLSEINDMNEEENLIEIDISRGSIMCPRFEIEA